MYLEDIREKRAKLDAVSNKTTRNMKKIVEETKRVEDLARRSKKVFPD